MRKVERQLLMSYRWTDPTKPAPEGVPMPVVCAFKTLDDIRDTLTMPVNRSPARITARLEEKRCADAYNQVMTALDKMTSQPALHILSRGLVPDVAKFISARLAYSATFAIHALAGVLFRYSPFRLCLRLLVNACRSSSD